MSEELPPRLAGQAASVVWAEARAPLLAEIERLKDQMTHQHESALSAFRAVEQERNAAQQVAVETQKELDHWQACYNTANKLCCQNAERGNAAIERAEAAERELAEMHAQIADFEPGFNYKNERDSLRAQLEAARKALQTIADWDGEGTYPDAQQMFFIARSAVEKLDAARAEKPIG